MLDQRHFRLLAQTGKAVADFLLPPRCPACACRLMEHGALCGACWAKLTMIARPFCCRCGLAFDVDAGSDAICGACIQTPPDFDWARAVVEYDGLARDLVLKLKHGAGGGVVPLLGGLMAASLPSEKQTDLLVPIPLHRRRLLKRRFNQSLLLASVVARKTGLVADPFVLERIRPTPSQGKLGRKDRDKNVRGAFQVRLQQKTPIAGKRILLIDDVLTTGATASACARELKKAGASEVGVLVFARVGAIR